MTTQPSAITTFVTFQNQNRGLPDEEVALDYDAVSGVVPVGGNAVTIISGIAAHAASIALGAGYNAVLINGAHSVQASTSSLDNYAISVATNGTITLLDENTGQSQLISGASYLVFDDGAQNADGSYQSIFIVEGGTNAQIAALYNAALGRQPDLPGLEYYALRLANGSQTLQQEAADFLASPEFSKKFPTATGPADNGGPNDQAFVTALYQNVLHRSPAESESAYYVAALQNGEAGSIVNSTNAVEWSRAQELINFALSPENQSEISGWLINTTNGAYTDPTPAGTAQAVVAEGVAVGNINTALITTINSSTNVIVTTATGTTQVTGAGYVSPVGVVSVNSISTSAPNMIISLSPDINVAIMNGVNDTINGASTGGSLITLPQLGGPFTGSGGTINLFGTGNILEIAGGGAVVTVPVTVKGFVVGDQIEGDNQHGAVVLSGSAAGPIMGANFAALTGVNANTLAINVGSVSGDTPAAMAVAANAAYEVGDVTGESVTFFGADPSGNTVLYQWALGDINHSHRVDAAAFTNAEILVGVAPSSIIAAMFH